MTNFLSIDLWDKRCGLAHSVEGVVFPLKSIPRVEIFSYLKTILGEKNISTIVVWLPYDLYGIDRKQLDKTKKFIQKLKTWFPSIPILEIDERFSTFEAKQSLLSYHSNDMRGDKDSIAACCILETYLLKIKNSL